MQTLQPDTILQGGKYIINKVLGQGGFGITYLAEHNLLGTKVAIKEFFMKEYNTRNEETSQVSIGSEGSRELVEKFKAKFLKEARNIARLKHPNIVRIQDVFEENGTAYYVMDYCEKGSLSELLKHYPNGIVEATVLKYIRQVASALQYIHDQKMNHLDVKPANILLDAQGNAVLIDFGLAKQYDVTTGNQTSTTPVGISHGYAPIEQYKDGGVSEFSPATDIYSLGATLYKLITGQTPPDAQRLIEDCLPRFTASDGIVKAICNAMQIRKSDRPQTVTEWMNILEESANRSPSKTDLFLGTKNRSITNEDTRIIKRSNTLQTNNVLLILLIILIVLIFGGALVFHNSGSKKNDVISTMTVDNPTTTQTDSSIYVESEPEGANVWIDNHSYGKTPLRFALDSKVHNIYVSKRGYLSKRIKYQYGNDSNTQINIKLTEDTSYNNKKKTNVLKGKEGVDWVELLTEPLGAYVYIDGNLMGETPLLMNISPGIHSFRFTANGYKTETRRCKNSEITSFVIELKKESDVN